MVDKSSFCWDASICVLSHSRMLRLNNLVWENIAYRAWTWQDMPYNAFRLSCCLLHSCFDGDICTTAQVPLDAEGRPSGKQHHSDQSISLPLCPQWQMQKVDSIQLWSDAIWWKKAKTAMPLRAASKTASSDQATLRQCSEGQASLKSALDGS